MALYESLNREFPIHHRNNHAAVARRERPVNNEDIAGVNPGLPHRLPSHPDEERRRGVLDEMLIEVEGAIEIIIDWRRISG